MGTSGVGGRAQPRFLDEDYVPVGGGCGVEKVELRDEGLV